MPQISIATAGDLQRPYRTTTSIPEDPRFAAGERLSQTMQKVAQNTQEHFQKIRQMREETELVDVASKWDAGIKDIHLQLETDADVIAKPELYMLEFNKRAQTLRKDLGASTTTPNVNVGFQNYVDRKYASEYIDAKARGLHYGRLNEVAKLDEQKYILAEASARADKPSERDTKRAMYYNLVDVAEKTGMISKVEATKRRQDFLVHSETAYMTVMGRKNPDLMLALMDTGAFDNVPELAATAIVDRSIRAHNAKEEALRRQEDRARKDYAEGLERQAEILASTKKLTQEWIDQNREYVTSEKGRAWDKQFRDQEGRIGTGDPRVEAAMRADVTNPNLDAHKTYATLVNLYNRGLVGGEYYTPWSTHLGSLIRQQQADAKSDRKEGEARVREIQGHRYAQASQSIERALGTRSPFERYDQISHEAMAEMHEELARRADYLGEGTEDSRRVYNQMLPKYIARVQDRSSSRLNGLRSEIGNFATEGEIEAARKTLGEKAYFDKMRAMREFRYISGEIQRLKDLGVITKEAEAAEERK